MLLIARIGHIEIYKKSSTRVFFEGVFLSGGFSFVIQLLVANSEALFLRENIFSQPIIQF